MFNSHIVMPLIRVIKMLLELEDMTAKELTCGVDEKEKTPLYLACEKGHHKVAEVLVQAHSDLNKK